MNGYAESPGPHFYDYLRHGAVDMTIPARDGVPLRVLTFGPSYGVPVVSLGGQPHSIFGPHPSMRTLEDTGTRMVAVSRRGYDGVPRKLGRIVADTATDIIDVIDYLGEPRVGLLARSGGTPHILGVAALYPERVTAAVAMSPIAPPDADIDWLSDTTEDNQIKYEAARQEPEALVKAIRQHVADLRNDKDSLLAHLHPSLRGADKLALYVKNVRYAIARGHAVGIDEGDGWIDDIIAAEQPWGFDVSTITAPVALWRGTEDPFSPASHAKWLAEHIPDSMLVEDPRASHLDSVLHTGAALHFILEKTIGASKVEFIDKASEKMYARLYGPILDEPEPTNMDPILQKALNTPLDEISLEQSLRIMRRVIGDATIRSYITADLLTMDAQTLTQRYPKQH